MVYLLLRRFLFIRADANRRKHSPASLMQNPLAVRVTISVLHKGASTIKASVAPFAFA